MLARGQHVGTARYCTIYTVMYCDSRRVLYIVKAWDNIGTRSAEVADGSLPCHDGLGCLKIREDAARIVGEGM